MHSRSWKKVPGKKINPETKHEIALFQTNTKNKYGCFIGLAPIVPIADRTHLTAIPGKVEKRVRLSLFLYILSQEGFNKPQHIP
jgi:hypothetical protein